MKNIKKQYNIYKTTNLVNGRFYWGVHDSIDENDGYFGSNKILLKAIKKYGEESFRRVTKLLYDTAKEAFADEKLIVTQKYLDENPMCYNIMPGGKGGDKFTNNPNKEKIRKKISIATSGENHSNYGKHLSDEIKLKISASSKGKTHSEETKQRMRKPKSEETKQKMRKLKSDEHKRKISIATTGENNPMYGNRHSEEAKRKMSVTLKSRNNVNCQRFN